MLTPEHEIRKYGSGSTGWPATGAPVHRGSEALGVGRRAGSVRRRDDGGICWGPRSFRLSPHRRDKQTAGPEYGRDRNRVRRIVLERTIRAAEPGLAAVLVERRRHAGHQNQRHEGDYDSNRIRRATRAGRPISRLAKACQPQIGAATIAICPVARNPRGVPW